MVKVKTFDTLPFPCDQSFREVYLKFAGKEINVENSKMFLMELSEINDDGHWTSLALIKYVVGTGPFKEEFKWRGGIWSFDTGENIDSSQCIRTVSVKALLKGLHLDEESETRLKQI